MAISNSGGAQFKSLRRYVTPEQQDAKLREVAKQYENQFLREMVKSMRTTVPESGLVKVGMGEKIFRDQLDNEYVDQWSNRGGVGFADVIYKQLIEKYGEQLGITKPVTRPQGPVPFNEKSNFQGVPQPHPGGQKTTWVFKRSSPEVKTPAEDMVLKSNPPGSLLTPITAPWSGKYLGAQQLGTDEYKLEIDHDNGLKSHLVFRGSLDSGLKPGMLLQGQALGILSPEAQSLSWTIGASPEVEKTSATDLRTESAPVSE